MKKAFLLIVLLFVTNVSFGYFYQHYSQFKINFLGTDHCVVGIESKNRTDGHLFVMNELTKEHYYTVHLFDQPSSVFLLHNKDFLLIEDHYYEDNYSIKRLKLYYQGKLVDSIKKKITMEETMKRIDNQNRYQFSMTYDTLNTTINWENTTFLIDALKQKILPMNVKVNDWKVIDDYYEISTKIWQGDLKINGIKAQDWFRDQIDTAKIKNFKVILVMNDFKLEQFDIYSLDHISKRETNAFKDLQNILLEAVITDEEYLARLGTWKYELLIIE